MFSGWLPPADSWHSSDRLPYGWETALDPQGKVYFINHINKTTSAEDPRKWEGSEQASLNKFIVKHLFVILVTFNLLKTLFTGSSH